MGGSSSRPDPTPSKPDPPPSPEFKLPWRRFNWGEKEELKNHLETFSLTPYIIRSASGDLPFSLCDIMGLEANSSGSHPEDIIKALYGHVKNNYKFKPGEQLSPESEDYVRDPLLADQAFCVVYIMAANSEERLTGQLRKIRDSSSENRIPQVIIMTKVDEACPLVKKDLRKIYTSKKIKEKMEMCSISIGVPMNHIFPVKNYHDEIDINDDVDVLILKALDQIVNIANDRLRDAASI
ncbi:interferon-induced protein 44-like isoform X2 [Pseudorasbora parva]|uniref:interferon-induced protein 44-like isoform X2 n=1 Tax=Pseudorasbora parva TaxID=51549 RepID=UPI00351F4AED